MKAGYFIRIQGAVQGPFSLDQLQTMRTRGQLQRFHEISSDRKKWIAAGSIIELFAGNPIGTLVPAPAAPEPGFGGDEQTPQKRERSASRLSPRTLLLGGGACVVVVAIVYFAFFRKTRGPDPSPPSDGLEAKELALKAHEVLKTHCFNCHGGDKTEGGFNVTERETFLKKRPRKDFPPLTPGKPEESRLWILLDGGDMPTDAVKDGRPGAADKDIIRKWIAAGALEAKPDVARTFKKTTKETFSAIRKHLEGLKPADRPHQRYFTLTNLYNQPSVTKKELDLRRAAFAKLVNSLTWERELVLPKAIDKEETVYPLDLRNLGWGSIENPVLHSLLDSLYPYTLRYDDDDDAGLREMAREAYKQTESEPGRFGRMPLLIRIDWFLAKASQPPLYETFLQLPNRVDQLEAMLKVNFQANFSLGRLQRAGFSKSGVSDSNRLIERHAGPYGGYWKSYDFDSDKGLQDLRRFPLGPQFPGNKFAAAAFKHAGGEMIFALPNHMQGYYLADEKGTYLRVAPETIVRDRSETTGTPKIVNGLSCIKCHKGGIIAKDDEILAAASLTLSGAPRDHLRDLYPERHVMQKLYDADAAQFQEAVKKLTASYTGLGEIEPVGYCAAAYLNTPLGLDEIAAELGHPDPRELKTSIINTRTLRDTLDLGALASGATITREQWESRTGRLSRFQLVADELGRFGRPVR